MNEWNHRIARGNLSQRDAVRIANKSEEMEELLKQIKRVAKDDEVDLEELIGMLRFKADEFEGMMISSMEEHEKILRRLGHIDVPTETITEEYYICPADDCNALLDNNMERVKRHLTTEHSWHSQKAQSITVQDVDEEKVEREVEIE